MHAHTRPQRTSVHFLVKSLLSICSSVTTNAIHSYPIVFSMLTFLLHLLFSLDLLFVLISFVFHDCVTTLSHAPQQDFKPPLGGWRVWLGYLGARCAVSGLEWWLLAAFQCSFARSEAT